MQIDGQWLVGTPEAAIQTHLQQIQKADERVHVEMSDVMGGVCA